MSSRNMRDVRKHLHPSTASSVPKLPTLPINKLSQAQLKAFIPGLMQLVNSSTTNKDLTKTADWLLNSTSRSKLKENITTDVLRAMVRNCYRSLGQEDLLTTTSDISWKTALARLTELQSTNMLQSQMNNSGDDFIPDITSSEGAVKSFVEIFVCYFCSEEFSKKEDLRIHQSLCTMRPPELQAIQSAVIPAEIPPNWNAACPQLSPQGVLPEDKIVRQSREVYMQGIDLVPVLKAQRIRASRRRTTEVELDVEKFKDPETPKSPRTPKSLISQLSRDFESSSCKRRLSYLSPRRDSDAESVISSCSSDDHDEFHRPAKALSLLFIDIASPLGQRVQNYMKADEITSKVLSNPESFCKTPVKDSSFSEKLRVRNNSIPVTFKLTRKRIRQFNRVYHFTKSQRLEAYDRLNTGLSRGSRIMKKQMTRCKVVLRKLTIKDFEKWKACMNPPKVPLNWRSMSKKYARSKNQSHISKIPCSYPKGPVLLTAGIDKLLGLRKKEPQKSAMNLTLTNVVSEYANAEVAQLKLSLYKSLLTELSESSDSTTLSPKSSSPSPTDDQNKSPQLQSILLSPCSVRIQSLKEETVPCQNSSGFPTRSTDTPLRIEIPQNYCSLTNIASPPSKNVRTDFMKDIDVLESDESISIRSSPSVSELLSISPNSSLSCESGVSRNNTKENKSKDKKIKYPVVCLRRETSLAQKDKPVNKENVDTRPKRKVGRPKKTVRGAAYTTWKKCNRNLSLKKEDCSRQIIKKYRKTPSTPAAALRKLHIDMVSSTFTPSLRTSKKKRCSRKIFENLSSVDTNNSNDGPYESVEQSKNDSLSTRLVMREGKNCDNTHRKLQKVNHRFEKIDSEISVKKSLKSMNEKTKKVETNQVSRSNRKPKVPKCLQINMVWGSENCDGLRAKAASDSGSDSKRNSASSMPSAHGPTKMMKGHSSMSVHLENLQLLQKLPTKPISSSQSSYHNPEKKQTLCKSSSSPVKLSPNKKTNSAPPSLVQSNSKLSPNTISVSRSPKKQGVGDKSGITQISSKNGSKPIKNEPHESLVIKNSSFGRKRKNSNSSSSQSVKKKPKLSRFSSN